MGRRKSVGINLELSSHAFAAGSEVKGTLTLTDSSLSGSSLVVHLFGKETAPLINEENTFCHEVVNISPSGENDVLNFALQTLEWYPGTITVKRKKALFFSIEYYIQVLNNDSEVVQCSVTLVPKVDYSPLVSHAIVSRLEKRRINVECRLPKGVWMSEEPYYLVVDIRNDSKKCSVLGVRTAFECLISYRGDMKKREKLNRERILFAESTTSELAVPATSHRLGSVVAHRIPSFPVLPVPFDMSPTQWGHQGVSITLVCTALVNGGRDVVLRLPLTIVTRDMWTLNTPG